jgi:pimeloyl-ACP methyl ester carboxylesterase
VLLHEYPGPMCGWWPYAVYLAQHGLRALLFDFGCLGLSSCPSDRRTDPSLEVAAAMSVLRAHGARTIALLGASMGGVIAVMAGAKLNPSAVIDLSGERDLGELLPGAHLNSVTPAPALRAPALFVVARGDRYVSVGDMRAVYRRAGSQIKRLIVLNADAGHGWDMLLGANGRWAPLARQVLTFIREHSTPAG